MLAWEAWHKMPAPFPDLRAGNEASPGYPLEHDLDEVASFLVTLFENWDRMEGVRRKAVGRARNRLDDVTASSLLADASVELRRWLAGLRYVLDCLDSECGPGPRFSPLR